MDILIQILLLAAGFVMLIKGADWFVDGASGIATKFGIPQLVIGLTIVAMGTSSPEAAVSISAAINGNADITIGNIVGSNILNIFIILGISALITTLAVAKSTMKYETPLMIAITVLLLVLGLDGEIGLIDGIIMLAAFAGYMVYLFKMAKDNMDEQADEPKKEVKIVKAIIFTIIGLGLIVLGSNVTVDAATKIAEAFGVSERFIGLTIVALGTSLPELFT
ncbi:MAG: calcium/sodium antiporter, partial [Oscillospiraceae bacterium]|nr:calcium/sodium antiporter [Oscillospiraceae bacterium]